MSFPPIIPPSAPPLPSPSFAPLPLAAVLPPPGNISTALAPPFGVPSAPNVGVELPIAPPPAQPPRTPPCTDKSCLDDPLAPKLAGFEVTAILEDGLRVDLNKQRQQRHLQQQLEEGSELLRMTPQSFAPAWLAYDLYARYSVAAVELWLGIPAGLTANVSYGGVSAMKNGNVTFTTELSYGGTLVQVSLVDPAYAGESTVYVLHAHRELPLDAPLLPALTAEAIGGNITIAFEAVRESTFDELALTMGGENVTRQPASHYTLTVTNPEQLINGEGVTVRYTVNPKPSWADRLTVAWEPEAAAESLSGGDVVDFEPPSGNASVVYVADATTWLLLYADGIAYSYAVQVDLDTPVQTIGGGLGGSGSNQNSNGGLGETDGVIGTRRPPPSAAAEQEEAPQPRWYALLLIGGAAFGGAVLLFAFCCGFRACTRRRRQSERERPDAAAHAPVPQPRGLVAVSRSRGSTNSSSRASSLLAPGSGVPIVGPTCRLSVVNPLVSEILNAVEPGPQNPRKRGKRPSLLHGDSIDEAWYSRAMESNPMSEFGSASRLSAAQAENPLWSPSSSAGGVLLPDEPLASAGGVLTRDASASLSERWMDDSFVATDGSLMMGEAGESETARWTENEALATAGRDLQMEDIAVESMDRIMAGGAVARAQRVQTVVNPLFAAVTDADLDASAGLDGAPWGAAGGVMWERNPLDRSAR